MWQCEVIYDVVVTKMIVFDIIPLMIKMLQPNLNCRSVLKPSKMAIYCGLGRDLKSSVKPNHGCDSNMSISMFNIFFISSWYSKNWRPFWGQGHMVTLWLWPLICDLEQSYFIKYFKLCTIYKYDYDIRFHSQDADLRICSQSHPLLNMNIVIMLSCKILILKISESGLDFRPQTFYTDVLWDKD